MKRRDYLDYLQDILDSVNEVEEFTEGLEFDDFVRDRKTINAVVRSLEVLGEASKKIPEKIRKTHSSIPWKKMSGMRDKLIHDYFGVDLQIVWVVVKEELPSLKPSLLEIWAKETDEEDPVG